MIYEGEFCLQVSEDNLENLLIFIVKKLVVNTDNAEVTVENSDGSDLTLYKIHVDDSDMCRIIGKKGRIIKSIRQILRSAAIQANRKISVEIC